MRKILIVIGLGATLFLFSGFSESRGASPWSRENDKKRAKARGPVDTTPYPLAGKFHIGAAVGGYLPLGNLESVENNVSAGYGIGVGATYFVSDRLGLDAQYRHLTFYGKDISGTATGGLYYAGVKFAFSPRRKKLLLATAGYGSVSGESGTFEFDTHDFAKLTLGSLYQSRSNVWVEFDIGYVVVLGKGAGKASFRRLGENADGLMFELSVGTSL